MPETFEYWNELATSRNYKNRFRSEYNILLIRTRRLATLLDKHEAGEVNFEADYPWELLSDQYCAMCQYLGILQKRAEYEDIQL